MTNYEREIVNGELESGAENGHTSKGFEAVETPLNAKQGRKYELLSAGSTMKSTSSGNSQWKNLNKYALCCALLASLNSTLLGYGKLNISPSPGLHLPVIFALIIMKGKMLRVMNLDLQGKDLFLRPNV